MTALGMSRVNTLPYHGTVCNMAVVGTLPGAPTTIATRLDQRQTMADNIIPAFRALVINGRAAP